MENTIAFTEEIVLTDSDQGLREIYEKSFPGVAKFVKHHGGSFDDAKDIFHDAMVIYIENQTGIEAKINLGTESYLVGIAKHLWIKRYNKGNKEVCLDETEKNISIAEDYFPSVNEKRLLKVLVSAGKKCMELLHAVYYRNTNLKTLAGQLGFSGEHSLSVQKYKCIEKIRNTVKEKSLYYDDFIDEY